MLWILLILFTPCESPYTALGSIILFESIQEAFTQEKMSRLRFQLFPSLDLEIRVDIVESGQTKGITQGTVLNERIFSNTSCSW